MASPRSISNDISKSRRMSNQNLTDSPFRQSTRYGTPADSIRNVLTGSKTNSRRTSFDNSSVLNGINGMDIPNSWNTNNPFLSGSVRSNNHNFGSPFAGPNNNNNNNNIPARSATPSVYSLNVHNPDPEIVKVVGRHLVTDEDVSASYQSQNFGNNGDPKNRGAGMASTSNYPSAQEDGLGNDGSSSSNNNPEGKFDSLKLQGGDITRQLYKWQQDHEPDSLRGRTRQKRAKSFDFPRSVNPDAQNIKVPGGFRRNFISQRAQEHSQATPNFLTRNFIEFLSLYGHFAGEELEEEDEDYDEDEEGDQRSRGGEQDNEEPDEETALLPRNRPGKQASQPGNATATKAVLLLLKSFVGTGVLFLPRAFFNGGILFSSVALVIVAMLSQLCFVLLIQSKKAVGVASFGAIGDVLYGQTMRKLILSSIVLSQVGFASAYIVFTSENLQALILALTNNKKLVNIETLIFLQLLIFLPLSMIRNITKLSGTALIADFFILLGLLYLYYWGGMTIARFGVSDVKLFNPRDWTVFIGTAIFTFEGIGLVIPIQESMKKPQQFTTVLGGVMIGITFIFVSMGALSYAAYGSNVKTVVILNLPQDSKFVNGVQLLYSLAILLSTPLQLFPAIRILENGMFARSGKYNVKIKWQKNIFRFFLVFLTAFVAWGGADDLDRFVALIGSFACIPLGYVYPPLLHLKACAKSLPAKAMDITLIILGLISMVYTTYSTISSWISNP